MKAEEISRMMERYWQCETSLEEEKLLQTFFLSGDVPEYFKKYKPLFVLTQRKAGITADKTRFTFNNKTFRIQVYPLLKAAASILLLLTIGVGFYTHFQQEKQMDKIFSDTYVNPADAVKETEQVVAKVSAVLQKIQGKEVWNAILDSLENESPEMIRESGNFMEE